MEKLNQRFSVAAALIGSFLTSVFIGPNLPPDMPALAGVGGLLAALVIGCFYRGLIIIAVSGFVVLALVQASR